MISRFFARLCRDTRGAAAIMLALGILPTVLIGYGALQYTEYSTIMTRLHQSQMHALYAVAKEGPVYAPVDGPRQGESWMKANMSSLLRKDAALKHSFSISVKNVSVKSVFTGTPLADGILGGAFDKALTQNAKALYYYRPIEVALALDGSKSFASLGTLLLDAVDIITENLFLGEESADDVWISMNFAAAWVNIGTQYADKLINPDSYKPYHDLSSYATSGTSAANYSSLVALRNKTIAMLERDYPLFSNNICQAGAPGYDLGVLCVHRKPLATYKSGTTSEKLAEYVADVFIPPFSPEEGFDMVQGVPIPLGQVPKNGQLMATASPAAYMNGSANSLHNGAVGYEGVDLEQAALLDNTIASVQNALNTPSIRGDYTKWRSLSGVANNYTAAMVTIPGGCPRMPMVIGAQDTQTLLDSVSLWGTGTSSSLDEGLAWAIRALEPDWADIWEIDDYPAPYGGDREKRIIAISDNDITSSGYLNKTSWGYLENGDLVNAYSPMCQEAMNRGIDIYLVVVGTLSAAAKEIYGACIPEERMFVVSNVNNINQGLAEATKRKFRVKLAEAN